MRQQSGFGLAVDKWGTDVAVLLVLLGVVSILNAISKKPPETLVENMAPVVTEVVSLFPKDQTTPQVVKIGQKELDGLTKISNTIPMKMISGKLPKAVVGPGGTTDFDESIYDFGRMMTVTSFSATPTCGGSGATNTQLSLFLSTDKAKWVLVGRSTGCSALSGTTKLRARYAGCRAELKEPFVGPGSITVKETVIKGFAVKR